MSYLKPLEKAIFYIENNLSENIKVEDVAREAGYSYYHFHRIFEMFLGETVGNYIRLRRLSKAAKELLYTDKRIIDITVQYKFESQESFSRAFKKVYKVTPSIKNTYAFISGTWLIKNDVEIDKREDFEYYDERFLGINNKNSEMDIYIPIR